MCINASSPQPSFDHGNRTYFGSDERLREFGKLSVAERLRWVEESARFLRLGQAALKMRLQSDGTAESNPVFDQVTGSKDI